MTDHVTHARLLKIEARLRALEDVCDIEPEGSAEGDAGLDPEDGEPAKPAARAAVKPKRRR